MNLIPLSQIKLLDRQRKVYNDIESLAKSIATYGILEPLIVDSDYTLICGGRRYTAATKLGLLEVPVVIFDKLTEIQKQEIELEENIQRSDITWQERVIAIAKIHTLRTRSANLEGDNWGFEQTGAILGRSKSNVWYAVTVADYITKNDEEIKKQTSLADAIKLLINRKEQEAQSALARANTIRVKSEKLTTKRYDKPGPEGNTYNGTEPLTEIDGKPCFGWDIDGNPVFDLGPKESTVDIDSLLKEEPRTIEQANSDSLSHLSEIIHSCSMSEIAPSCPRIDHIYCDPPYAIDMDNIQQNGLGMNIDITRDEHQVAKNQTLLPEFLRRSWELLPDTGFCVFWYDLDMHDHLQLCATELGFKVQRWPLIWVKTHSCQNGAASYNFTKSTEVCMVLRKPKAVLAKHCPSNYWIGSTDKQNCGAIHPFWKPLALHKWILESIALPGQTILDPFAGEGSIPVACLLNNYKPIAYECNEELLPRLQNRILTYL